MRLLALAALPLCACTLDYRLAHDERRCDGEDNDNDGVVDDGFGDADQDGMADCIDRACEVAEVEPESFEGDAACGRDDPQVADPWALTLEVVAATDAIGQGIMPALGPLVDTNGDARIDRRDEPYVVFAGGHGKAPSQLIVLSPDGELIWSREGSWFYNQGPMIGDVTGDGRPEILVIEMQSWDDSDSDLRVVALDGAGNEQWVSDWSDVYPSPYALSTGAADLDGDGAIEVLALDLILDGRTGETKATLDLGDEYRPSLEPIAGDLDGDGTLEVFTGGRLYSSEGALVWDAGDTPFEASAGAWLQADGDVALELFVAELYNWRLLDDSGAPLAEGNLAIEVNGMAPAPPCVSDFDGDGRDEVVWKSADAWAMFDPDTEDVAWTVAGAAWFPTSCVAVDLDVDGDYEVIVAAEDGAGTRTVRILEGATGSVLAENETGVSLSQPVVADIDLDGSAEIVLAGGTGTGTAGLEIWGHPENGWPTTTSNWYGHDHSDVNVDEDGTVNSRPDPAIGHAGVFRGHRSGWGPGVDLTVEITGACVATCESDDAEVRIGTAISNVGAGHAPSEPTVSLYAEDADGRALLGTHALWWAPLAGTREPGPTFTVTLAEVRGKELVVVVDPDDTLAECDEAYNEARITIDTCP